MSGTTQGRQELTMEQWQALEAAVDVAYDGTPEDDAERLAMEGHARKALADLKPTERLVLTNERPAVEVKTGRSLATDLMEDR